MIAPTQLNLVKGTLDLTWVAMAHRDKTYVLDVHRLKQQGGDITVLRHFLLSNHVHKICNKSDLCYKLRQEVSPPHESTISPADVHELLSLLLSRRLSHLLCAEPR
jgi:hypothetical protein